MQNILFTILLFGFSTLFGSCELNRSATVNNNYPATAQPTVETKPSVKVNSNQVNAANDENSFECVRAEPEPIIKKEVFPKTTFRLEKNKEFPHQNLGYETVEFENDDKLLIENIGCENFTLVFHFETDRFNGKTDDVRFWYKIATELLAQTDKGIGEQYSIKNELKALNSHIKKTKQLKFNEEIDYCGTEIRCVILLDEVKKLENNNMEIIVSFGTGPL